MIAGVISAVDLDAMVSALRGSDGSLLWHTTASSGGPGSLPSPVQVVDGMLYLVCSSDGGVDALRASDGTVRWHATMGQPDPGVFLPLVVSA